MNRNQIVAHLSELPVEILNDIRFSAAVAHNANPLDGRGLKKTAELIAMCNEALEEKQAMRLRGYDIQDAEFTFV